MRTFEQLTQDEQEQARTTCFLQLCEAIAEGGIRFNDELNGDDLQARIDKAAEESERLRTPWFFVDIALEDAYVEQMLKGMAECDAEDALYPDETERIVRL